MANSNFTINSDGLGNVTFAVLSDAQVNDCFANGTFNKDHYIYELSTVTNPLTTPCVIIVPNYTPDARMTVVNQAFKL